MPLLRRAVATAALAALAAACDRKPVVVTGPVPLSPLDVQYPEDLWESEVQDTTVLALWISEQGTIDSVRVQTPAAYPAFDSAAVAATRGVRFRPATRDGKPVPELVYLPVEFRITAPDSAAPAASASPGAQTQ